MENKNGRTLWDLIAESKILVSFLFAITLIMLFFLVRNGATVKVPGVELSSKQEPIYHKDTTLLPSLSKPNKPEAPVKGTKKKYIAKETDKISNNSSIDNAKIEPSVKIENNGINNGIMAKEVNLSLPSSQRKLTEMLKEEILSLPIKKQESLFVSYQQGDIEAQRLAIEIGDFLSEMGYKDIYYQITQLAPPVYGLRFGKWEGKPEILVGTLPVK